MGSSPRQAKLHLPQLFPPPDSRRLLPKTVPRNVSQTISRPCQIVVPPEPSASTQPVPHPLCTNKSDPPWRALAPSIVRCRALPAPPALAAPMPQPPTKLSPALPPPNFRNYLSSQFLPLICFQFMTN